MTGQSAISRQALSIKGVVQGVGFRPFVYNLALSHGLVGFVGNDSNGVFIEIEGKFDAQQAFCKQLKDNPPPLAHIESIESRNISCKYETAFSILDSHAEAGASTLISPDLCICDDCLRELYEADNRRYRYPFINCTNCGPRFSIIRDIPYDRPYTTMADFVMCEACQAEYDNPTDRRFHAQPNACPDCGPQLQYIKGDIELEREPALGAAIAALDKGLIVAIKGIGGFHLACDASNHDAVARLRERKGRGNKPFAVMVRDSEMARQVAHINGDEQALLESRERPIVLLKKTANSLSKAVAPDTDTIGVMLPYTPLHYLLVDRPLVMTSANYAGEPIVKDNAEALEKLNTLADAFLLHDRDIHVHCDDSVMHVWNGADYPVRRSRGYAPFPVKLPFAIPQILAVGAELKSTFCLTKNQHAFMSQHIGDMENLETLQAFERACDHMQAIFRIQPEYVVADKHPRYLSSQWAKRYAEAAAIPLIEVQHHHAHVASVMAENGLTTPVIGFSYDGTGYGDDGAVWGGEVLIADYKHYQRDSFLPYMPIVGGDAAIKNPYRLALAYLRQAGIAWDDDLPPVQSASQQEKRILSQQLERRINVVQTSSMGRLFDVVAALIGVCQHVSYEAQAAIKLEALAIDTTDSYPFETIADMLQAIIKDMRMMTSISVIAGKFHNTIAEHIAKVSNRIRRESGISTIVLTGGVFQNMTLLNRSYELLKANNFEVYTHRLVPANDGGIALGQAMIASQLI